MPVQEIFIDENVFVFETVMRIRNTEVDVGQFLTVESMVALLSEARARFLYSKGIKDVNGEYQGLIVNGFALNMPGRVKAREELLIEVGVSNINKEKAILHFRISRMHDGSIVGKASSSLLNFDYRKGETCKMSQDFIDTLEQTPFEI